MVGGGGARAARAEGAVLAARRWVVDGRRPPRLLVLRGRGLRRVPVEPPVRGLRGPGRLSRVASIVTGTPRRLRWSFLGNPKPVGYDRRHLGGQVRSPQALERSQPRLPPAPGG